MGRSHPQPDLAARSGDSALFGGPRGNFDTEAVDHARMRALLQPHFAPKHMRALIAKVEALHYKRMHPGDDVISRLCATEGVADGEAATSSMHLLFAGHETTVVQIGWDALLLLTNPGKSQALCDNPALIPNAVEELLRGSTRGAAGIAGIPRNARTDLQIDGVAIRAGDLVLLDLGSANHDPAMFGDPDSLDFGRKHAAHLSFGYGRHFGIGAPLARIELKTVFFQLIPRFPGMQLAVDPITLRVHHDVLAQLPVSW